MNDDMPIDEKRQLEDYQRLSALFQFYLEHTLKVFTFVLGIADGVSAFVLGKEVSDRHPAALGLLLPSALCIGMGVAFLRAVPSTRELNEALQTLKKSLNRSLAPHATNLTATLFWFGCSSLYVASFSLGFSSSYLRAADQTQIFGLSPKHKNDLCPKA
jgi:hypothetical protein